MKPAFGGFGAGDPEHYLARHRRKCEKATDPERQFYLSHHRWPQAGKDKLPSVRKQPEDNPVSKQ